MGSLWLRLRACLPTSFNLAGTLYCGAQSYSGSPALNPVGANLYAPVESLDTSVFPSRQTNIENVLVRRSIVDIVVVLQITKCDCYSFRWFESRELEFSGFLFLLDLSGFMTITSLTLLERARLQSLSSGGSLRRDNEAWDRLVDLYTPLLFRWSRRTGLDDSESEDLVQEIFRTLLDKLGAFERQRDGSFRKWLQVVTVNKCKERFRRKQLPIANFQSNTDPLSAVADPATLVEFWEGEYKQELVLRAMQIMQAEFSEKLLKSCWQHIVLSRPAIDVAEELGITANAVRVYSSRVLARLRSELRGLIDE